ncbi:HD domain-containing protein [Paenibacillus aceris]|uniref:HD superfamily phosphohydrolase n=1 Tax=Paenibacillus aceris TaxID=869555 RepID=A0ABS4I2K8_9BACL|nr:HD domain-containing protein [Paenibacillus aceris]MBP1965129.1 HD superfamily phosphohydrolase [Paenibacillus aceris]NHW33110.1 HD domain-containing protein [Paenibacillus aceris]
MSLQHTFSTGMIREPLYKWHIQAHPVEVQLFRAQPVRRLKFLHHFGASALFSPMTHSRFEHTVGVWSLMAHFCPDEPLLRIAALLHDIGHLPFSHAVERTLGYDHHMHTERLILGGTIADILTEHGISPTAIVSILKQDSPLTNKTSLMGLDHLDSFLRDTYYAGQQLLPPSELVRKLRLRGNYIETDEETAAALIHAVVEDHRIFLSPPFLAMDALLAKAVAHHCESNPGMKERLPSLLDHELIQELLQSTNPIARDTMNVLMYEPHRIQITEEPVKGSIEVNIRKIYKKQPLIGDKPASETSFQAAVKLEELNSLTATYFFNL